MIGGCTLNISTVLKQGALIVRIDGEMDLNGTDQFRNTIDSALENSQVKYLIISLKGVSFIDSSGVGVILGRYKKISAVGGKLLIANVKPQVARILDVSGLLRIIKVFSSESEALDSL
ncbi:MAG: anti-sigma-factor antagonist [Firmicutes bacterium]|nr:anti-sigma-factor antagonist [Bacillota bacterium]